MDELDTNALTLGESRSDIRWNLHYDILSGFRQSFGFVSEYNCEVTDRTALVTLTTTHGTIQYTLIPKNVLRIAMNELSNLLFWRIVLHLKHLQYYDDNTSQSIGDSIYTAIDDCLGSFRRREICDTLSWSLKWSLNHLGDCNE